MYGIYTNIGGILMVNVTIYSSTMDPMGNGIIIMNEWDFTATWFFWDYPVVDILDSQHQDDVLCGCIIPLFFMFGKCINRMIVGWSWGLY